MKTFIFGLLTLLFSMLANIEMAHARYKVSYGKCIWVNESGPNQCTPTTSTTATPAPTTCSACLPSGKALTAGQSLYGSASYDGNSISCKLVYQGDGNLVLYATRTGPEAQYFGVTSGKQYAVDWTGTTGYSPGKAIIQGDGNFVVYDSSGRARWASNTFGSGYKVKLVVKFWEDWGLDCFVRVLNSSGSEVKTVFGADY